MNPPAAASDQACMHGTLEPVKLAATRRRSLGAKTIALVALAVLAGIAAGAVLVYTPVGDDLLVFFGFIYPKDCG
jgi:hypothetical protein